jgi:beta-D-xylosidase 4
MNMYQISNPNPNPPVQVAKRSPICQTNPICANKACDTSLSQDARIKALLSEMTVDEKAQNLVDTAAGIPRLGLPPYEWWSEVSHKHLPPSQSKHS